ncbi:hypothetical protein HTV80_29575 [Streptomyces sp. Vc74B-19]|uniref:hypothetical protein n=1 Tax=Streptomyces sp. Vc74B-19 TaxID=2741324 RepID=UPI001BFC97ED|nr:hypothetical protein [Streptomyces sp. Vc74B-19]MBT3167213.1 hypothetical protein [Streptomyces sp. Vc74B-19]
MSPAGTWGLLVETTVGTGQRKHVETHVVAHVTGSRQEALAELERRARAHSPAHPLSPKRRRLLRTGDGFLLVVDGAWQSFATRFTVAELLEDSDAPREPEPVVEETPAAEPDVGEPPAEKPDVEEPPAERPDVEGTPPAPPRPTPEQPAERDADGVPVLPSWLGRSDLS